MDAVASTRHAVSRHGWFDLLSLALLSCTCPINETINLLVADQ